ncbi:MAG: tRNA dihydrouridine synthase DusB [Pseudooceanicola sp.]|nr:tRNA dihydrouridine synthase DusB [Pseudooceanicola sp.]
MIVHLGSRELAPPVFLAPMAGITDRPFRDLVSRFGAGLVVSEMVASREMVQARRGTRERTELGIGADNTAVQLAGCEAVWMAEAARKVADSGAAIIDINMGCPAKKVTNSYSGSALMRTPDHALRLIEAVVAAVDVPVTLKMRLGWDHEALNAPAIAARAEAAGIRMITVHGRTRCQFYTGRADWHAIRAVVEAVSVPVIANGDITGTAQARQALAASGAAGVMVGRGAQGRPWQLVRIAADLFGAPSPDIPEGDRFVALIAEHYEAMLAFYGIDLGLRVARKHLGWYLDTIDRQTPLRRAILTSRNPKEVLSLLRDVPAGSGTRAVAA